MPITVSTPVNETRYFELSDPESYVVIRPPDFGADKERSQALSKRTLVPAGNGGYNTQIDANLDGLWALEIWLTYVETNLVVNYTDTNGDVTETVSFKPRPETSRVEFLRNLDRLPPGLVFEWHSMVVDVVRDWMFPF